MARRANEADHDNTFSLIGGKTETTDGDLVAGLKREKDEEIGPSARVKVCWRMSCYQVWFQRADGRCMVLPHHVAIFAGGDIQLNPEEYTEYRWVPAADLHTFQPLIPNIPEVVRQAQRLLPILTTDDFEEI